MSQAKLRVCVIGAGPSGMSVLYQLNQLKAQGQEVPEIVCFEETVESEEDSGNIPTKRVRLAGHTHGIHHELVITASW